MWDVLHWQLASQCPEAYDLLRRRQHYFCLSYGICKCRQSCLEHAVWLESACVSTFKLPMISWELREYRVAWGYVHVKFFCNELQHMARACKKPLLLVIPWDPIVYKITHFNLVKAELQMTSEAGDCLTDTASSRNPMRAYEIVVSPVCGSGDKLQHSAKFLERFSIDKRVAIWQPLPLSLPLAGLLLVNMHEPCMTP